MTENGPICNLHSGIDERMKALKWLFAVLIGCLIGLFSFQGVLLSQVGEIKTQNAVMSMQIGTLTKQMSIGIRP